MTVVKFELRTNSVVRVDETLFYWEQAGYKVDVDVKKLPKDPFIRWKFTCTKGVKK